MRFKFLPLLLLICCSAAACGPRTPLERLKRDLDQYPEYSVILQDMNTEGSFFTDYFHQYKYVFAERDSRTDSLVYREGLGTWEEVSKQTYNDLQPFLGMVVASKGRDGKITDDKYPPGYQYVGNSQYGQWRTDSRGGSFWEWYGKYALFSSMFGMFNRPVYRNDWSTYQDYRRGGRPYYGSGNAYGTNGTHTKKSNPNFYERRVARERARKTGFRQKVGQRVRRSSMSTVRSRGSSRGK